MLNKLLVAIGLAKGPGPLRRFVTTKAMFGTVPALAYVAWRNRDRIADLYRRYASGSTGDVSTSRVAYGGV